MKQKNQMLNSQALMDIIKTGGLDFKEGAVSFILSCPRCNKSRKLYIHKNKGMWICFRCSDEGFKGRKPEFILHELYGTPLEELKAILYGNYQENLPRRCIQLTMPSIEEEFEEELIETTWNPNFVDFDSPLFDRARDYLINKRGLREEHIQFYNIKYNPAWRTVVFPVVFDGVLYGWQERSVIDSFKYTLKGFKKERILMFQDRLSNSEHAILTEGPLDGLKCHILGGNVCSMGKGVSTAQLKILKNMVKRVYVGLDPDATKELNRVCRELCGDVEVFVLQPPMGRKDLGECTEEEILNQFHCAEKYTGQCFINMR